MAFFDPEKIKAAHGRPIILQDSIGRETIIAPIEGGGVVDLSEVGGSGAGPTFSAIKSVEQTYPDDTYGIVLFQTAVWNDGGSLVGGAWTPSQAGIYQFNVMLGIGSPSPAGDYTVFLQKNGVNEKVLHSSRQPVGAGININGMALASSDGDDAFSIVFSQTTGSDVIISPAAQSTCFQGVFIRANP